MTAWQALVDYAALEPGERVLIQGGAGAVGCFAVQLAASLGGHVTATGRERDASFVRDLGAERFCQVTGLTEQATPAFDVVIDGVGGAALESSYSLLREGGRLVTLSAPPDQDQAASHNVHAMFFIVAADPDALAGVAERAISKSLRPVISQVFPLAEGRQAYQSGQHPRPPGTTILGVR